MPAETVMVLTVVIGMFAIFMGAVGAVWIWTNLPEPKAKRAPATAGFGAAASAHH